MHRGVCLFCSSLLSWFAWFIEGKHGGWLWVMALCSGTTFLSRPLNCSTDSTYAWCTSQKNTQIAHLKVRKWWEHCNSLYPYPLMFAFSLNNWCAHCWDCLIEDGCRFLNSSIITLPRGENREYSSGHWITHIGRSLPNPVKTSCMLSCLHSRGQRTLEL